MGALGTCSLPESQPQPVLASAVPLVWVGVLVDVKATHCEG